MLSLPPPLSGFEVLDTVEAASSLHELAVRSSSLLGLITKIVKRGDSTARELQARIDHLKRTAAHVRSVLELYQQSVKQSTVPQPWSTELKIWTELASTLKMCTEQLGDFENQLEELLHAGSSLTLDAQGDETASLAARLPMVVGLREDVDVYINAMTLLSSLLQTIQSQRSEATQQQLHRDIKHIKVFHKHRLDEISRSIEQMSDQMQRRERRRNDSIHSILASTVSMDMEKEVDRLSNRVSNILITATDIKTSLYSPKGATDLKGKSVASSTPSVLTAPSVRMSLVDLPDDPFPDATHIEPLTELADRLLSQANSDFSQGHFRSAENHQLEAIKCFGELHDCYSVPFDTYGEMKMRLGTIYQNQQKFSDAHKIWQAARKGPITYSSELGWKKVTLGMEKDHARFAALGYQGEANTYLQQYQSNSKQKYLGAAENSAKRAFRLQRGFLPLNDRELLVTVRLLIDVYSKSQLTGVYAETYRNMYLSNELRPKPSMQFSTTPSTSTGTQNGSVSVNDSFDNTGLIQAVTKHDEDEIDRLIGAGVVHEETPDGKTAMMFAMDCGCSQCDAVIDKLLRRGVDRDAPLCYAVKKSNQQKCRLFLRHDGKINQPDRDGFTPLMHAVKRENSDMVRFLIWNNADVNAKGENGRTALHVAVRNGDPVVFEKLLSTGWLSLNVDSQDDDGLTALHECAKQDNTSFARRILRCNANPEIRDKSHKHRTPLWIAVKEDKYEIVKLLLQCGARVDMSYLPPGSSTDIRKLLKLSESSDRSNSTSGTNTATNSKKSSRKGSIFSFGRSSGTSSVT